MEERNGNFYFRYTTFSKSSFTLFSFKTKNSAISVPTYMNLSFIIYGI